MKLSIVAFASFLSSGLLVSSSSADNKAVICSYYNYTLQTDSTDYDIQAGLAKVDGEGWNYLNKAITKEKVDVSVINFTSSAASSSCSGSTPTSPLDTCSGAESQVCVLAPASLDQDLMKQLSLSKVQTYMDDFNANNLGEIFALFDYPITVKSWMAVILDGALEQLNEQEKQAMCNEILASFAPVLANTQEHVLFELIRCKVVAQSVERRQRLRSLGDGNDHNKNKEGNTVSLLLTAHCAGQHRCNSKALQVAVDDSAPAYTSQTMLGNLQDGGGTGNGGNNGGYFDQVHSIQVTNTSSVTLDVTNVMDTLNNATKNIPPVSENGRDDELEKEAAPWWVWVLVGGPASVLLLGLAYTLHAVKRRNKQTAMRKAFEDHNNTNNRHSSSSNNNIHDYDGDFVNGGSGTATEDLSEKLSDEDLGDQSSSM